MNNIKIIELLSKARLHLTLAYFWALAAKNEANNGNDYKAMEFDSFYYEEKAKAIFYIFESRKERVSWQSILRKSQSRKP